MANIYERLLGVLTTFVNHVKDLKALKSLFVGQDATIRPLTSVVVVVVEALEVGFFET